QTAADGSYDFTGLRPGTYSLGEAQPSGYLDGKTTVGTQGGTAGDDQVTGISLQAGVTGANNDFGELQAASVSGWVYFDRSDSGIRAPTSDPGIAGVTVTLSGVDDRGTAVNLSTTSGADGSYAFNNLRPGTFT